MKEKIKDVLHKIYKHFQTYGKFYIILLALIYMLCMLLITNSCNTKEIKASTITITSDEDFKGTTFKSRGESFEIDLSDSPITSFPQEAIIKFFASMSIMRASITDKSGIGETIVNGETLPIYALGGSAYYKTDFDYKNGLAYNWPSFSEQYWELYDLNLDIDTATLQYNAIQDNIAEFNKGINKIYDNDIGFYVVSSPYDDETSITSISFIEGFEYLSQKFVEFLNKAFIFEKETPTTGATINVIYDANGGAIVDADEQQTFEELEITYINNYENDTITITQQQVSDLLTNAEHQGRRAERDGWELLGWSTSPNGEIFDEITETIQGDLLGIKIYAIWRATRHNIYYSFNANGGTWSGDAPGEDLTFLITTTNAATWEVTQQELNDLQELGSFLPITLEGYEFIGWSTSPNGEIFKNITTDLANEEYTFNFYAKFEEEPHDINIKITINNMITWQGVYTTTTNLINMSFNWHNTNTNTIILEDVNTNNIALVNTVYGNAAYSQNTFVILPMALFKENSYINSIKFETPNGATTWLNTDINIYTLDVYDFFETQNKQQYLRVNNEDYYINISIEWNDDVIINGNYEDFSGLKEIFQDMFDVVEQFLNIKIGFITIWNIIVLVLAITILGFIIKVWQGGNNG